MGKIECEHKWIDKGAYNECSLCGEIRLKHSTTVNGIICDDVEKGNYRFVNPKMRWSNQTFLLRMINMIDNQT